MNHMKLGSLAATSALLLCFSAVAGSGPGPGTESRQTINPMASHAAARPTNTVSLDGRKVMFLGNSFVHYGNCVIPGDIGKLDYGYFYQIARANGERVEVYDYTPGGQTLAGLLKKHLTKDASYYAGFDYVFMSEAGFNSSHLVTDCRNIMAKFPRTTKFYYLCHSFTYQSNHQNVKNALSTLKDMGVGIVNWGELVHDVWTGATRVPGSSLTYNKLSFIKNKGDTHHENMLSGYITAMMTYCAVTGKSAVGQAYAFCGDSRIHSRFDIDSYIRQHYKNAVDTNMGTALRSAAEMKGFQQLMDRYNAK